MLLGRSNEFVVFPEKSCHRKSHVFSWEQRFKLTAAMTLEGDCNRPNTVEEEEDLEAIAEADNQPLARVLEPPEEPAEHFVAAAEEPLFPNVLPDFTPSIEEINRSLNSIQEDINQLALRSATEIQLAEATEAEEEDDFVNGKYLFFSNTVIDKKQITNRMLSLSIPRS